MEKNLLELMNFVYKPEERIQKHRQQIQKCIDIQKLPLNGDVRNVQRRQHVKMIEEREREALRVIEEGIERRVFEYRLQKFFEIWNHLPSERRRNEDQLLNYYCKFFQSDQSIPEIITQRVCPKCHSSQWNDKLHSDWDCSNPDCALFQKYITPRTSVRIAYSTANTSAASSESKTWTKFISQLAYFVDNDDTPSTKQLREDIVGHLSSVSHGKSITNYSITSAMINKTLKHMEKKDLCPWSPRILVDLHNSVESNSRKDLMKQNEFEEIESRMDYMQRVYVKHRKSDKLELCDAKYAFRQICILYGWRHLIPLFPINENATDKKRWDEFTDFLCQYDQSTVWKIPTLDLVRGESGGGAKDSASVVENA
jgi:hypothetical protein